MLPHLCAGVSTDVSDWSLSSRFRLLQRSRRQLQNNRLLSSDKVRDHDNLVAREFKRIMMDVRIV
jgi:hypothetical protein